MTRIGKITVKRDLGQMKVHTIGVVENGVLKMAEFRAERKYCKWSPYGLQAYIEYKRSA